MSTQISKLPLVNSVAGTDSIVVDQNAASGPFQAALSTLQEYMQSNLTFSSASGVQEAVIQRNSPAASGFSVTMTDASDNAWLQLTPLGGFATGTIVLPNDTTAIAQQTLQISSTQAVINLTININGAAAIENGPTTIIAGGTLKLTYDAPTRTWYGTP